jgi:hypothetical protein
MCSAGPQSSRTSNRDPRNRQRFKAKGLGLGFPAFYAHKNLFLKSSSEKEYKKQIAKLEDEFPDLEIFMKKKEKFCATKVKALLFDKVLEKIYNEKNNIQQITAFFGGRK